MTTVIEKVTYKRIDTSKTALIPSSCVPDDYVGVVSILPYVTISNVLCKVVEISGFSFCRCKSVTEIIIPDTITTIRQYAFAYLTIKRFIFPKSITLVESYIISDFAPKQIIFCGTKDPTFRGIGAENKVISSIFKGKVIVPIDYESNKNEAFQNAISRKRNACMLVPKWEQRTCNNACQTKINRSVFVFLLIAS